MILLEVNMIKIKEQNYSIKNETGDIILRSIKNNDLIFYKDWHRKGHLIKEVANDISEDEIEKYILHDTKRQFIFIIEINQKPCGEIVLWNDTALILFDKNYSKPFYNIWMKYYEDINNDYINDILKLFIESIKQVKIKIGSLYVFIDEKEEQNYSDNYINNGFKYLNKELYKTKLNKYFEKMNMENPYNKLKMLIK
jgi:hypothetical protein